MTIFLVALYVYKGLLLVNTLKYNKFALFELIWNRNRVETPIIEVSKAFVAGVVHMYQSLPGKVTQVKIMSLKFPCPSSLTTVVDNMQQCTSMFLIKYPWAVHSEGPPRFIWGGGEPKNVALLFQSTELLTYTFKTRTKHKNTAKARMHFVRLSELISG